MNITIPDEAAMVVLSTKLAQCCKGAVTIFLSGPLGVGKTTFTRGFLRALGFEGLVKSPTYTLVESYELADRMIYHFDFYRLKDPEELEAMGIRDYFAPNAICLIEWPELGEGVLPHADLSCYFSFHGDGRMVKLISNSPVGNEILQRLEHDK